MTEERHDNRKRKVILVVLLTGTFLTASVYSLQAPFLPAEAEKKGVTPTEYGLIFGIYELVILLSAPVVGANIGRLGSKFTLCSGYFIIAICCSLFGFLNWSPGPTKFLGLAFSIRILEGLGQCFCGISGLTIMSAVFPDSKNEKMATLSSFFTVGMVISPSMGGLLYTIGGFSLPFHIVGGLILLGAIISIVIMPSLEASTDTGDSKIYKILWKSPYAWLPMFCLFSTAVAIGFLQSTLEPHIRPFHFSTFYTSLFFVINPLVQAGVNRFLGQAIDKGFHPRKMMIIGGICIIAAYSVIGPFPGLPIDPNPYLIIAGLCILGVGIACNMSSGFGELLRVSQSLGLEQNEETNGVVSSLWQTSMSSGIFAGPFLGGVFLQYSTFRWGCLLPIAFSATLILIILFLVGNDTLKNVNKKKGRKKIPDYVTFTSSIETKVEINNSSPTT